MGEVEGSRASPNPSPEGSSDLHLEKDAESSPTTSADRKDVLTPYEIRDIFTLHFEKARKAKLQEIEDLKKAG